jgi:hypothetical protein
VRRSGELSYKFQRLRERLRQAVLTGELSGKLPGERILAKRYNCNAKTLSKALTDLAAEGLLDRSIGRGTYVRGSAPAGEEVGPWLLLGEGNELEGQYVREFLQHNPRCQLVIGEPQKRPSFVNQFSGVIDVATSTPDSFLRDLVVRGIPVVVIGREPRTYSLDCVLVDALHGVTRLTRDLVQRGHRQFVAVQRFGQSNVAETMRHAVSRPGSDCTVDTVAPTEVLAAVTAGATALVCDGSEVASSVLRKLQDAGIDVPGKVSVVAVGVTRTGEEPVCTGCFVPLTEVVENAIRLLSDTQSRRPTTLWLAPVMVNRGTTGDAPMPMHTQSPTLGTGVALQ